MHKTSKGELELSLLQKNQLSLGVDEVGRGCLAGPVYAAAVSLNYERLKELDKKTLSLIRDSKSFLLNNVQKLFLLSKTYHILFLLDMPQFLK